VILRLVHLLIKMRQQAHAAPAALFADRFGQRLAVMAFCGARVNIQNFFGNLRGELFADRNVREHFAVYSTRRIFDLLAFRGVGFFRFGERGFRELHHFLRFFRDHHLFELYVFQLSDFRFGVGNFVQQRFVGFVRLHRRGLRLEFFYPFAPLGDFEVTFFAGRDELCQRFFRGRDGSASPVQFGVIFTDAFGGSFQIRAQRCDFVVGLLKFEKQRNRRMHEGSLTQRRNSAETWRRLKKRLRSKEDEADLLDYIGRSLDSARVKHSLRERKLRPEWQGKVRKGRLDYLQSQV